LVGCCRSFATEACSELLSFISECCVMCPNLLVRRIAGRLRLAA
jgi:hypothetical protein